MKKQELQEAMFADVLDGLGKVQQSVEALPQTLQKATADLTEATQNSQEYTKGLKEAADKAAAASVENTRSQLTKEIAKTVEIVVHNTSKKNMLQWAAGCLLVSVLSLLVFGYLMYVVGQESAYQKGRSDAVAGKEYEKDACTWFNTQEGQMAIGLYEVGSLQNLYTCNNPGWVVAEQNGDRVCIPLPEGKNKQPRGWQLPLLKNPKTIQ
jgi:hypothetical protein